MPIKPCPIYERNVARIVFFPMFIYTVWGELICPRDLTGKAELNWPSPLGTTPKTIDFALSKPVLDFFALKPYDYFDLLQLVRHTITQSSYK